MLRYQTDFGHFFPRQPALAPVVHQQLIVKPKLYAAVRIGLEQVVAADGSFNFSLPLDTDVASRWQVAMNPVVRMFLSIRRSNIDPSIGPRRDQPIEVSSGIIRARKSTHFAASVKEMLGRNKLKIAQVSKS